VTAVKENEIARLLKRGLNHYGLGELDAAIGCWERVRALDPDNQAARDYLETAYEERAEADQAETPVSASMGVVPIDEEREDATPQSWDFVETAELPLPEDDPDNRIAAALEAYKSGKIEEAWCYLQEVAREMPDRLDVQGYLGLVRTQRAKRFAREIGDKARALRLTRSMGELKALNLRPDEGFLLSQIDGSVTIEELISLSSTDRVRTLETLARFLREGLVE
jgi:tetratricopeptide (TPR) repeat protein